MDYKTLGRKYERFGNFNYGAVGSAMGIPSWMLKRAAGAYQMTGPAYSPGFGSPIGSFPYGDDPNDQTDIRNGILYYESYDQQYFPWYIPSP